MQIVADKAFLQGIIDRAFAIGDSIDGAVDVAMKGTGLGMVQPSPEELATFFMDQQKKYPPQPWTTPDGRTIVGSPWILALGVVDGGEEWLKKFEKWSQATPDVAGGL